MEKDIRGGNDVVARITLKGMAVVLSLAALFAFGELRAQKPTKTITGTVKSAEVYRGKIRTVYIENPGEGDFLVARGTEISKELVKHVGATVKATGYVRKWVRDPEFERVIDILSYEIQPAEEPTADLMAIPQKDE